jgi:hypothetical protein
MTGEPVSDRGGRRAGREILSAFLRFLGVSIVLYVPYDRFVAVSYSRLVALIATPFLALFGVDLVMAQALKITEDISLNPLVFLSLVIAVGRIPARSKLRAALIGVAILTALNALTVFLAFMSAYRNERMWTETEFVSLTMNFFVPLLLWLVLLPIRSTFPLFGKNE